MSTLTKRLEGHIATLSPANLNRHAKLLIESLARIKALENEINDAKDILRSELDRDYDEQDTLRILVVVAVNALHRERSSK